MTADYVFKFQTEGQGPFARKVPLPNDAAAIDFGRTAVLHQIAVHGVPRATVLVARTVSPDGAPLGWWFCAAGAQPVWNPSAEPGSAITG